MMDLSSILKKRVDTKGERDPQDLFVALQEMLVRAT